MDLPDIFCSLGSLIAEGRLPRESEQGGSHNNWVAFTDFLSSQGLIIKATFMLVAVSVYGTEESSTSACKPRESNLLLTRQASVLFLLSILLPVFFTLGPPHTATPSNIAQVGFCLLR